MINYLLDRFYYKNGIRLILDAVMIVSILPALDFIVMYSLGHIRMMTYDRAFQLLFFAPWYETFVCLVPIIEVMRRTQVKSWVTVLTTAVVFGLFHKVFFLGLSFGIVFASVYVVTRRFSFLHAVLYTTTCHFLYNLLVVMTYGLAF